MSPENAVGLPMASPRLGPASLRSTGPPAIRRVRLSSVTMLQAREMKIAAPVTSLYAHVPFCQTICGYCDFFSVLTDRKAFGPLVDALLTELETCRPFATEPMQTIFVGGGTPTTLPPDQLRRLLTALHAFPSFENSEAGVPARSGSTDLEFTVEANPATVSPETADVLVSSGVNRVSIGAQSFDTSELRVLDRIHAPPQVAQTVEICRRAGLENLNLDLIFAIPGQTLESWVASLRRALDLGPDHLSCYALTYERGTPLFDRLAEGRITRADTDLEAEMYEATIDELACAGLAQYEISNFAKPHRECRHNLVYWRNLPYFGIGPSAAGFVDETRYKNIPDVAEYARAIAAHRQPRVQSERLTLDARARETAMLALRLNEGLRIPDFRARFGSDPLALFADAIARHTAAGTLEATAESLRLTRPGRLLADTVCGDFL